MGYGTAWCGRLAVNQNMFERTSGRFKSDMARKKLFTCNFKRMCYDNT